MADKTYPPVYLHPGDESTLVADDGEVTFVCGEDPLVLSFLAAHARVREIEENAAKFQFPELEAAKRVREKRWNQLPASTVIQAIANEEGK